MKLINGRILAEKIKDKVALEIHGLGGPRPGLALILVGERPDSKLYISLKEKQAGTVGIETHVYRVPESITQAELIDTINFLNNDSSVDAILVQLPLPEHLDTDTIINTILPEKDIDGFTKENMRRLLSDDTESGMMPPVYGVIFSMLESINCTLSGKKVSIIGNSNIFAGNLEEVVKRQDAVMSEVKDADIIITAVGKANSLTASMVKDDAVIIDIGITQKADGSVTGDVDAMSMENKSGYLSPVPGGVGPMTIAMAFWNTLLAFKKQKGIK